jgi:hypothetical protein
MANNENQPVGLAEAIQNLRQEMTRAIEQAKGQELRFDLDEVELDLGVEVKREAGVDGKVSFKVFGTGIEAGGKGSQSQTSTHRMKITLKPPAGSIKVSDEGRGRPK